MRSPSGSPSFKCVESPSEDWDILEEGMQVVVGEIMPEWECARDLMSPYSDLVCGGEKVPLESSCPVVEEMGEESMLESLHTVAERCG